MPVPTRPFGRTGLQVPLLGFGALPITAGDLQGLV
jgi:hypothetical protein